MANDLHQYQEKSTNDMLQLVVFSLGTEEFSVDIMKVQEIIRLPEITRIPKSPDRKSVV